MKILKRNTKRYRALRHKALWAPLITLCALGCELDEPTEANNNAGIESAGSMAGFSDGGADGGEIMTLCGPIEVGSADDSSFEAVPEPSDCTITGCQDGERCVVVDERPCGGGTYERCDCDEETGEVTCVVMDGPECDPIPVYECVSEPPVGGDEPPPAGVEPPPGGMMGTSCEGPNPAESCLTEGCAEGKVCAPTNDDSCTPSSCQCDGETGEWLCTRDCLPSFACLDAAPCEDADQDGVCDDEDSSCESDRSVLSCRQLAPECPRGTVPQVVEGCYTDRCVTWEECARALGDPVDPPVDPLSCGGFRPEPVECPDGMYCRYEEAAMCGAADAPGLCTPLTPELPCPDIYAPICGCDGQTYSNSCEADRAGASVASQGACEGEPIGGLEGELCGSRGLPSCAEGLFCHYPPESMCGEGDQAGVCELNPPADMICPAIFLPVCGCDGLTYGNDCLALAARASIAHMGACQIEQIQCGGFAGLVCPRGMSCVDDPADDCDPDRGGADCMGICVER
jgi:hypothetical protein